MQSRNEMEVKTDLLFHIVLYIQVKWIIWKQKNEEWEEFYPSAV